MAIRATRVDLWPHQRKAYDAMAEYVREYRAGRTRASGLVHMPTATGKTGVIAVLVHTLPLSGLALVLSPRIALRDQLAGDMATYFWHTVGVNPSRLSRKVINLDDERWASDADGAIVVMTVQRLVREERENPGRFRSLCGRTQLLILDEGHVEPAPRWSQVVRTFDCPRILFTATPFRNDLKAFDIDFARHSFSYSFEQATNDRVIRAVEVVAVDHPRKPAAFANQLVEQYRRAFQAAGVNRPRVIVRCEDHDTIRQICMALQALGQTVIGVHERFPSVPTAEHPYERKGVPQRQDRAQMDATFWVHQYKLLEGIDEPRFQMVAFYDALGSTRAVIQQIGRVLRNPGRRADARAIVLDHSGGDVRRRWDRYRDFDRLVEANQSLLAHNLSEFAAERIASALPQVAYVLGDFRKQLNLKAVDPGMELRFPSSAKVYDRAPGTGLAKLAAAVESEFMAMDRVYIGRTVKTGTTRVWSYISVRNSPYLRDSYFLEPAFHVAVVHLTRRRIFYTDSGGHVSLNGALLVPIVPSSQLRRLLYQGSTHRLTRVSLRSANLGPAAVRSRAVGAYTLDALSPSFDDHLFVCQTAQGRVTQRDVKGTTLRRRYLGFGNGRVTDGTNLVVLRSLLAWFNALDEALGAPESKPMRAFSRFASPRTAPGDPWPVSVLLDIDGVEDLYQLNDTGQRGGEAPLLAMDDLCHDVDENGSFAVMANDQRIEIKLQYASGSQRYSLASGELEARYVPRDTTVAPSSVVRYLNETQAFRVLPRSKGVVYAAGAFYRPVIEFGGKYDDSQLDLLAALDVVAELNTISTEKGQNCAADESGWEPGCLFDLIARRGSGTGMAGAFLNADIVICDDMGTESADFIVADTVQSFVAFVHAKASSTRKLYSASALQEVVGQAQKNLRYAHPYESARPQKAERWHRDPWRSDKVVGRVKSRILVGQGSGLELWERIRGVIKSPQARKEVWLVLGNMLSKENFEAQLRAKAPAHEAVQAAYLLEGLISTAMSLGIHVRVFCMP